ncbi:MAG: ABC transporter ATP-binding protein [Verrucomicrobiales bacterium]
MIAELTGITKSYEGRAVLQDLALTIAGGESLAMVGSSGCGKSTLLNIIGTLDQPDSGEVRLFGEAVAGKAESALADLRGRAIGFVFQLHHLLPQLSVLENVLVPTLALQPKPDAAEAEARAKDLLGRVGLGGHLAKKPAQLSGGERQRAAVVRALINRPKLLLADEPTGALDRANAESLIDLLAQLNQDEGVAIAMVTHDAALAARMGKVLRLEGGKLVEA